MSCMTRGRQGEQDVKDLSCMARGRQGGQGAKDLSCMTRGRQGGQDVKDVSCMTLVLRDQTYTKEFIKRIQSEARSKQERNEYREGKSSQ